MKFIPETLHKLNTVVYNTCIIYNYTLNRLNLLVDNIKSQQPTPEAAWQFVYKQSNKIFKI